MNTLRQPVTLLGLSADRATDLWQAHQVRSVADLMRLPLVQWRKVLTAAEVVQCLDGLYQHGLYSHELCNAMQAASEALPVEAFCPILKRGE